MGLRHRALARIRKGCFVMRKTRPWLQSQTCRIFPILWCATHRVREYAFEVCPARGRIRGDSPCNLDLQDLFLSLRLLPIICHLLVV